MVNRLIDLTCRKKIKTMTIRMMFKKRIGLMMTKKTILKIPFKGLQLNNQIMKSKNIFQNSKSIIRKIIMNCHKKRVMKILFNLKKLWKKRRWTMRKRDQKWSNSNWMNLVQKMMTKIQRVILKNQKIMRKRNCMLINRFLNKKTRNFLIIKCKKWLPLNY